MLSRFVCPVFAERSPVELRVVTAAREQVVRIPSEHVVYVSGHVAELVALERTAASVVIHGAKRASFDLSDLSSIRVESDFDAFTGRVLAAPHRAVFDAIVVGACAWGLDVSLPVAGRLWAAAKGAALSDAEVKGLRALVKNEVDLVDPDRFASQSEFRSLDAIDAALVGDGPRLVRKGVAASLDEPAAKRRLSVIASALARIGAGDALHPVAIDVLAIAFRPAGALEPGIVSLRSVTTTIGGSTITVIETTAETGRKRARFGIQVDGVSRRARARITWKDGWSGNEESEGWLEGEDAELELLVNCLEANDTKRLESNGQLSLDLDRDAGINFTAERTRITVDISGSGPVVVDIHHTMRTGSFY